MNTEIGRTGESVVSQYLEKSGYTILQRNYRTRRGEIDIIATSDDTVIFIEVKTWPHGQFFDLAFVINAGKQKRMVETAKHFLVSHRNYISMYVRFDVILLSSNPCETERHQIRHLKDAFSECV